MGNKIESNFFASTRLVRWSAVAKVALLQKDLLEYSVQNSPDFMKTMDRIIGHQHELGRFQGDQLGQEMYQCVPSIFETKSVQSEIPDSQLRTLKYGPDSQRLSASSRPESHESAAIISTPARIEYAKQCLSSDARTPTNATAQNSSSQNVNVDPVWVCGHDGPVQVRTKALARAFSLILEHSSECIDLVHPEDVARQNETHRKLVLQGV